MNKDFLQEDMYVCSVCMIVNERFKKLYAIVHSYVAG